LFSRNFAELDVQVGSEVPSLQVQGAEMILVNPVTTGHLSDYELRVPTDEERPASRGLPIQITQVAQ
jgi:hypothetical protein